VRERGWTSYSTHFSWFGWKQTGFCSKSVARWYWWHSLNITADVHMRHPLLVVAVEIELMFTVTLEQIFTFWNCHKLCISVCIQYVGSYGNLTSKASKMTITCLLQRNLLDWISQALGGRAIWRTAARLNQAYTFCTRWCSLFCACVMSHSAVSSLSTVRVIGQYQYSISQWENLELELL